MSARERPQKSDQHDQYCTGRHCVSEQRKRDIIRERLGHDARSDNSGHKEERTKRLCAQTSGKIDGHTLLGGLEGESLFDLVRRCNRILARETGVAILWTARVSSFCLADRAVETI